MDAEAVYLAVRGGSWIKANSGSRLADGPEDRKRPLMSWVEKVKKQLDTHSF